MIGAGVAGGRISGELGPGCRVSQVKALVWRERALEDQGCLEKQSSETRSAASMIAFDAIHRSASRIFWPSALAGTFAAGA